MPLPPETTFEEIKVRVRKATRNPNVGSTEQVVLKEGPRAFRLATLIEIIKPESGEVHHHVLKIDSIDRTKKGWFYRPEKSVSLEGQEPDEIDRLFRFIKAHLEGKLHSSGDLHILSSVEYEKLGKLVDLVPNLASPDMVELVKLILPRVKEAAAYLPEFVTAFSQSDPETVGHLATAARVVQHTRAYDALKSLVGTGDSPEQAYQELLSKHPWMFGSEYSELLDRRKWTRDDNVDFMLRRTSDNFLEIIEIKTPFTEPLFIHDKSHDSYYPSSKLSPVIGQVMRYISEIERSRDQILSKDKCDTLKIRARIIAGRDGDEQHQAALRTLNGHLHRLEVITFDQLLRIAARVLAVFDTASRSDEGTSKSVRPF